MNQAFNTTSMPTYESLTNELKRIHALSQVSGLLEWDEQVNLPENSGDFRAQQSSVMAGIVHREATNPKIGEWLNELIEDSSLTPEQKVVIREARKDYDRRTRIPEDFVAHKAGHLSKAYHAWVNAKSNNDFKGYAPFLEKNILLAKEEAAFLGQANNPYDYWIDSFDPGLNASMIESVFDPLQAELVPLAQEILHSSISADTSCLKGFPLEKQESFMRKVTSRLGFDYSRGRIDRSVHPFCSGCAFDTRMTTRFFEDNPLDSLFSSIHETGHGLYEQGLPLEHIGTGLGAAAGMAVHESQSRLWENQVARSRQFWKYWEPVYRETFKSQLAEVSSDDLYLAINSVSLNPIRVDSDEVTYNLHILLRFRIEKALFDGSLAVKDLPGEWNRLSKEIIGLEPKNNAEGVLQDVHWSGAAFGYFPSYCLGNLLAAQLWYKMLEENPTILDEISEGNFTTILEWMRNNVHQYGQQYYAIDLAKKVTNTELSHHSLIRYLQERYLPLYTS